MSKNTNIWTNSFNVRKELQTKSGTVYYYSLPELSKQYPSVAKLPYSIKILLEAALRQVDGFVIQDSDVKSILEYDVKNVKDQEIPFKPARVLMQDFTGVPGVVDLAAMRNTIASLGGDPKKINPVLPVDLVIDHSVQVDHFGTSSSLKQNMDEEFSRNTERYKFLRWGSTAFSNFRVVPPATGIVHQVNLEYLANVVQTRENDGKNYVFPDSLVGTDSHTTMINGLGVVGWGVGGIEAEAVMLDQPIYMLIPEVVGFKLKGELQSHVTATDLVLTITQMLRKLGVVGKFVEFYGSGLKNLTLADRATIANMAPEYGATMGFFPVDGETLKYLEVTGRSPELVDLVEKYSKAQGLFATEEELSYSTVLELDVSTVEPSIAGPKRPQDRINLKQSKSVFHEDLKKYFDNASLDQKVHITLNGKSQTLTNGSVVIAAITSCTNTSNPSVLLAAGLLAKKAVSLDLSVPSYVKTSLTPGSRVVTRYLENSGLADYLDRLGFNTAGYGCGTCIGNSGPIADEISKAINDNNLVATAVLSGNRNFEGRIHQDVKANYLASPPLVVAYAIAGTMNIDFEKDPLGKNKAGKDIFLKDIWPTAEEVKKAYHESVKPELFAQEYQNGLQGPEAWVKIQAVTGDIYKWDTTSTYIAQPTFFEGMTMTPPGIKSLNNMNVLAVFGDSVTTDHISPAGSIKKTSPAGKWLMERGVEPKDFNTYGARRGNHEVMMRGTFANTRIKNLMLPGVEGGETIHVPSNERMTIYDAAMKYKVAQTPLIILAGKEYGTGSSRDWAAKGTNLLGVKVVIAESFERIHRSNLIGMGILPLQFKNGATVQSLGLTGKEVISIPSLDESVKPKSDITVAVKKEDGSTMNFVAQVRIDTPVEVEYLKHGGILTAVLRKLGGSQ